MPQLSELSLVAVGNSLWNDLIDCINNTSVLPTVKKLCLNVPEMMPALLGKCPAIMSLSIDVARLFLDIATPGLPVGLIELHLHGNCADVCEPGLIFDFTTVDYCTSHPTLETITQNFIYDDRNMPLGPEYFVYCLLSTIVNHRLPSSTVYCLPS